MDPETCSEKASTEQNSSPATPQPLRPGGWAAIAVVIGRIAVWAVLAPPRRGVRIWAGLRPAQQLVLGFASYVAIGAALLCLPASRRTDAGWLDHIFTATSAVSTTGLTTVTVEEAYSFFGQGVILALFQLGGIGYMTLTSILVLARGGQLSECRLNVLRAGFALPRYFVMHRFLTHVVVFTLIVETAGALILWWRLSVLGVQGALWSGVFHSVSAFATAGFGLHPRSLEPYAHDPVINGTIAALCYLGAIGFIVVQDVWYTLRLREWMMTFTSKVVLWTTGAVFALGTILLLLVEPGVRELPWGERVMVCAFQVMTASTTAGFNTIPIGMLSPATLLVIIGAMIVGASPSGTGGGLKTTAVSALWANLLSVLRRRERVTLLGHEVPMPRLLYAAAAACLYALLLFVGLILLVLAEPHGTLPLVFEACSALGTVGLSMGITGDLSATGKWVLIALMFAGRCGPLTLGLAMLRPAAEEPGIRRDDLAI